MEADGRLLGLVLTYFSESVMKGEREPEERESIVLVVKFQCDEQQEPSAEGQMHVSSVQGHDGGSKANYQNKQTRKNTACLLIKLKDNLTCTALYNHSVTGIFIL